jgi:hypothetical protein
MPRHPDARQKGKWPDAVAAALDGLSRPMSRSAEKSGSEGLDEEEEEDNGP